MSSAFPANWQPRGRIIEVIAQCSNQLCKSIFCPEGRMVGRRGGKIVVDLFPQRELAEDKRHCGICGAELQFYTFNPNQVAVDPA